MREVNVSTLSQWPSTNLAANINGPWQKITAAKMGALSLTWTGSSLNGTFSIQTATGSAETFDSAPTGTPSTLAGSTYTMTNSLISGDSNLQINLPFITFSWVRVVWTFASGTGTLTEAAISLRGE